MSDSAPTEQPRLQLERITKTFGRYRALDDVSFTIGRGELHGLVGQNGSGKSTLAKVLSGYHSANAGSKVTVDGEVVRLPVQADDLRRHGVAVVHQSFGLLDDLTVLENLRLGRFGRRRISRSIDWSKERLAVAGVLERLNCHVDYSALVGSLTLETKATLAIARAIQGYEPGRGLIIFDESTRALNRDALTRFYQVVRSVIEEGASVLLICHRIEEVLEHTDRVTVLRDGKVAAVELDTSSLTESDLTRAMLGYSLTRSEVAATRHLDRSAAPCVSVEGLRAGIVKDFSTQLRPGEIVGVTGLAGSGFSEIPYVLSGAATAREGSLSVGDHTFDLSETHGGNGRFLNAGISLIPRDREHNGLLMDESIQNNITLPRVKSQSSRWLVNRSRIRKEVSEMILQLGISPAEPSMVVGQLSGGNQQKVLLGKWLAGRPSLLLLHEPTQAVDVGARRDIIRVIEETAQRGCPMVVASTYADELALICDRVLVFHDGEVVAELDGELSEDAIIEATFRTQRLAVSTAG